MTKIETQYRSESKTLCILINGKEMRVRLHVSERRGNDVAFRSKLVELIREVHGKAISSGRNSLRKEFHRLMREPK